ncbi:Alpha/Beta hydrolase fold [Naviculisporaceae sp. PSN 640]
MSISSPWTFTPFPALPATFLPNIAIYNATNTVNNLTYQITLSYPFEWGGPTLSDLPSNLTSAETLTLYVTDGNALALTAAENVKRRKPVDSIQPDTVVVSIGYPFTDRVYDLSRRGYDFRPPYPTDLLGPEPEGTAPSGADEFIEFINGTLRPWVRSQVFPGSVNFTRDCLYGHSFGGLFVVYALAKDPGLFDTFVSASPGLWLYNTSILDVVARGLGGRVAVDKAALFGPTHQIIGSVDNNSSTGGGEGKQKPAVFIGYGSGEQFPKRLRARETEEEFWTKRNFLNPLKMTDAAHDLYDILVGSGRLRDVVLKEYADQDHAAVAASAIGDGAISYFIDW